MLAVLKLAKRAKCFSGDLSVLRPPDLHAGYKPRTRNLNRHELAALLAELDPDRGAMVAIGVALGVRLGEAQRLLPTDIDWDASRVFIRGTKTKDSKRYVPILSLFKPLLEVAVGYLPLRPWGKVWRDIQAACKRAGIPPCSTNDFRRTHATLLAEVGVDADVTRRLLGHTTRNLVDRVYGQPSTEALAVLAESKLLTAHPLLPQAIVDSDTARIGVAVSTPELQRLIPAGAGDEGSIPSCVVGPGTPGPTAGATPVQGGYAYEDVTIGDRDHKPDNESSVKQASAPVAQWIEQRFPKSTPLAELDAGILGFRGDVRRWIPPDAGGFGWERRGVGTSTAHGGS